MNFKDQTLFGLPPGADFAAALVDGLCAKFAMAPPADLARVQIIVNTRRLARRVSDLFAAKENILHPKLHVLNDLSGLAPQIMLPTAPPALSSRFELLALVEKLLAQQPDLAARSALFDLTDSLAQLIEEMQDEGVGVAELKGLNVSDQSGHWQRTHAFLTIAAEYLAGRAAHPDMVSRQRQMVEQISASWQIAPIPSPVILAGSTGSRGTTLSLMKAVAALPQGVLLLPGFDFDMPMQAWSDMAHALDSEDHPQYRFVKLFAALAAEPRQVARWAGVKAPVPARGALVSLALRPAPVTDCWLSEGPALRDIAGATSAMTLLEAPSPRLEAMAIAMRLREAAEEGLTAALITPDRGLTRQVSAALSQWGIIPDDSAGMPLHLSPPGRLLRQALGILGQGVSTPTLLALLKHPLAHSGGARNEHLLLTRDLELYLRAKAIPFPQSAGLQAWAQKQNNPMALSWAGWVSEICAAHWPADSAPFADLLSQHLTYAEAICRGSRPDEDGDAGGLWQQKAGRQARETVKALQAAAASAAAVLPFDYAGVFNGVLAQNEVRDRDAPHPKILIWGTLEARVQGADLLILAGLNEGVWPQVPPPDPWLNRRLRHEAGLLLPERRIGLSAHDFQQAIAAGQVWLTRSVRNDEAQTIPARWVNRLTNLLNGLPENGGAQAFSAMRARGDAYLKRVESFESWQPAPAALRPAPAPPKAVRPQKLSVTEIKTLIRDPYAIYAKHVLGLAPLEPIEPVPDSRLRGVIYHALMEQFIKAWPDCAPVDRRRRFVEISEALLCAQVPWPSHQAFWRSRLRAMADWVIAEEERRQTRGQPLVLEGRGAVLLPELQFTLSAIVDRIDMSQEAGLYLYDYKTGAVPTPDQQKVFDKQLYLLAAIAQQGGFENLQPGEVAEAAFIGLGAAKKYQAAPFDKEPLAQAWEKFKHLIASYQSEETGFQARRALFRVEDYSPYDQLSRYGEWSLSAPARHEVLK